MVLIPLRSQYVSLIISIVSLFAELALLRASLSFNGYFECRALRKGKEVSVNYHQRRAGALSILALLAFLSLETITSDFSEPAKRKTLVEQSCVAVDGLDHRRGPNGLQIEEDFVSMRCNDFRGENILFKGGNYSFEEERVICATSDLVEVNPIVMREEILDRARRPSAEEPNPNPFLQCINGLCVVFETVVRISAENQRDTVVKMFNVFKESDLESLPASGSPGQFVEVVVFYNSSGLIPLFAERALEDRTIRIRDSIELTRRIFLGSATTSCPFDKDLGAATSIPLALIVVVSVIWLLSFAVYISSCFIRAKIFYDISNPIHWIKLARHNADEHIKGDPYISSIYDGGIHVVQVSESQEKK
ncbi:hypothetical protein FGB62_134g08 [Gracilaria domingensis]|nr:hypothetical protein FGB62_134g08 [Gracilaria domingensis]